ncbi:MAG: CopG family ribbon-helix-helix protein [Candidatus Dormibacteria bacterium]
MKTAVSLPDDIFAEADRLADRLNLSRSALYRQALSEYLQRHQPGALTTAMDQAIEAVGEITDPFAAEAGRRVLQRVEW